MTALSRKAVEGLLLLLLVWPPVQFALTRFADVHPWRLYGFGMYSTGYSARVRVEVSPSTPSPDSGEIRSFERRRAVLGKLISEEGFARRVLVANPALERLEVTTEITRWDPARGENVGSVTHSQYDRAWLARERE